MKTGYKDKNNKEIHYGDILNVFHKKGWYHIFKDGPTIVKEWGPCKVYYADGAEEPRLKGIGMVQYFSFDEIDLTKSEIKEVS